MNVAVIGSGGREHALALKIKESKLLGKLFCIPGNPGTAAIAENFNLDYNNHSALVEFCGSNKIDLVVVGPEQPLVNGITDILVKEGIKVFGPSKEAARLEGEKSYSKNLMKEAGIPTAGFEIFTNENYNDALDFLSRSQMPVVIKADGLAAGKGVLIASDYDEAKNAIDDCLKNSLFGTSGHKVVIEEFMTGQEASIFAITDGTNFILLPAAQDHKRIGDGDTGRNTGGMGAYAPTPFVNENILKQTAEKIVEPTLKIMRERGHKYSGCLYCGLMITEQGPKVVEYNCRFGDPETQVVLPLLEGDFLELLFSAASGNLNKTAVKYSGGASVVVVAASKGYPDSYEKGKEISGLEGIKNNNIIIYHSGTKEIDGKICTNGGRVLGITSAIKENNLSVAKQKVYNALQNIYFDGIYYRTDIADKAILK